MPNQRKLTVEQEQAFLVDYQDGWTPKELTIIYRVSIRTVYRTLARYDIPKVNKRTRKRRVQRVKSSRVLKPCGTNAAYARHKRKGEYPCTPCLEAHAQDVATARIRSK